MRRWYFFMCVGGLFIFIAFAQAEGLKDEGFLFQSGGHYVNLFSASKTTTGQRFISDLQRIRLEFNLSYREFLKSTFIYDSTFLVSNFIKTSDFYLVQSRKRKQFLDLDDEIVLRKNFRYEHFLYRAYIDYRKDDWEILVGRQQIPWGLGKFWTPTDLFNPYDPLSLEKEERQGVDALNIHNFSGYNKSWEIVYLPQKKNRESIIAGRMRYSFNDKELGVITGESKEDEVIGIHFLTNLIKASLRMEGTFTNAQDEHDYFKFVFNIDYTFPNSFYLLGEYYYNGQGRRDKNTYQRLRQTRGEIDFMGQDFLGLTLGYDVTSLIRFNHYTVFNLNDQSLFFNPEIHWSISQNNVLLLGAQLFVGKLDTEFGRHYNQGYLRWKTFF